MALTFKTHSEFIKFCTSFSSIAIYAGEDVISLFGPYLEFHLDCVHLILDMCECVSDDHLK